jgi:hypothetical protein
LTVTLSRGLTEILTGKHYLKCAAHAWFSWIGQTCRYNEGFHYSESKKLPTVLWWY